jgi:hypothetical protein
MGPTCFIPRSHSEAAHAAYNWGQPSYSSTAESASNDTSDWSRLLRHSKWCAPLLNQGDCVLFDSRLMHFGSANSSDVDEASPSGPTAEEVWGPGRRRVLFYLSLRARGSGSGWRGCGFDKPGTLLNDLRGRYFLGEGQRSLVVEHAKVVDAE